jgi:hypothetical protein
MRSGVTRGGDTGTDRGRDTGEARRRLLRYHRLAGYLPLGYGLFCVMTNLHATGPSADFGLAAGVMVAAVGLVHLRAARRLER